MTPIDLSCDQRDALLKIWESLGNKHLQIATIHYQILFERAPKLKQLFRAPIDIQARRLDYMFNFIIENIDNPDTYFPYLIRLGFQHKGFKVKKSHYPIISQSIKDAFESVIGKIESEAQVAWNTLVDGITNIMLKGAAMKYIPQKLNLTASKSQ